MNNVISAQSLRDDDWNTILERIDGGNCTPFIGPGARIDGPDVYDVARLWASEFEYPPDDYLDLPRVGRHVSVKRDVMRPKELIQRHFGPNMSAPNFSSPTTIDDPHRILAELPFPIYITTNYDDLMWRALKSRGDKDARKELCRWNDFISTAQRSAFDQEAVPASPANPIVFHLYGHTESLESLVVTDDDYLEFLISVSRDQSAKNNRMIPSRIERAMNGASLIFLGYRIDDWDFRVLFHLLLSYRQSSSRMHVAVQIAPNKSQAKQDQQEEIETKLEAYQAHLGRYFQSKNLKIHVSLKTCQDFVKDLRDKWKGSPYAK